MTQGHHYSSFFDVHSSQVQWDLRVYQRLAGGDDEEEVIRVGNIGTLAQCRQLIESHFEVQWRGTQWGVYSGDGFFIEFDLGAADCDDDEIIDEFGMVVVGEGSATALLNDFAQANQLVFCDARSGDVVEEFCPQIEGDEPVDAVTLPAEPETERAFWKSDKGARHSLEGRRFEQVWINLRAAQHNLVAMNGEMIFVATLPKETLYRLIDEHQANHRIVITRRIQNGCSRCFKITSVMEIIDHADSTKCEILHSRFSWPLELTFASVKDKSDFLDTVLTQLSGIKHVVQSGEGISSNEVLLLVLAVGCAALGSVERSLLMIMASLAVLSYVVYSMMRNSAESDKTKEVYRFKNRFSS